MKPFGRLDSASRAAAVRERVSRLLGDDRDREIAESYRPAYSEHSQDEAVGEAGLGLLALALDA